MRGIWLNCGSTLPVYANPKILDQNLTDINEIKRTNDSCQLGVNDFESWMYHVEHIRKTS